MDSVKRKLRGSQGVTIVFALAVFLVMTLFSYVMVNASLSAAQSVYLSRNSDAAIEKQQAYYNVRFVSQLMRDSLKSQTFTCKTDGIWASSSGTSLSALWLKILNKQEISGLSYDEEHNTYSGNLVITENTSVVENFEISITAKHWPEPTADTHGALPLFIVKFHNRLCPVTMTITSNDFTASAGGYTVRFDSMDVDLNLEVNES